MHAGLCCFSTGGLVVFLLHLGQSRQVTIDLRLTHFSLNLRWFSLSASVLPQWLFLNLRTKCTTLLTTCRGMLMCLIWTHIWHCTGSLLRIQKVGQTISGFLHFTSLEEHLSALDAACNANLNHLVSAFWKEVANEFFWKKPATGPMLQYNFDVTKGNIYVKFMEGAKTNICYNILDRHVRERNLFEKVAYYW